MLRLWIFSLTMGGDRCGDPACLDLHLERVRRSFEERRASPPPACVCALLLASRNDMTPGRSRSPSPTGMVFSKATARQLLEPLKRLTRCR